MKSLDDVTAPQEGVAFWTWGERREATFEFRSEFGEPRFSQMGLLEAHVVVDGTEFILAPGSRRLLFALKPFAPLTGKRLRIVVDGDGMKREFRVSVASSRPLLTKSAVDGSTQPATTLGGNRTL